MPGRNGKKPQGLEDAEEERALAEMRRLLGPERGPGGRLWKLERMERAAQVWVNGDGGKPIGTPFGGSSTADSVSRAPSRSS